ncbi:MAG: protoporphyrinogen oxidase [Gammaproteobacteria bacterium]
MDNIDVLIVGGGISGLAIARLLANEGMHVEVWERDNRPGGKINTELYQGYRLEQSASMVVNFRREVKRFLIESGLDACKTPLTPIKKRYLICDNQLHPVPLKLLPMIASPLWSWRGMLRMAMEPFIPRGGHENETVADFIRRRLGNEILEKAMEPYIAGLLASDADHANAFSTLPRLTALERRYGSLTLGILAHKLLGRRTALPAESFSFKNGMSTLTDTLAGCADFKFRSGCSAIELIRYRDGWRIHGRTNGTEYLLQARQIVLSIPADAAASLIRLLDPELGELLHGIEYAPLAVVHTGFDCNSITHPLDGNGFLTPRNSGLATTGCLWMSSLFPDRAPEGKVLLSNYLGGARMPDAATWDEEHSVNEIMKGLKTLLGIKSDPEMVHIHRHEQGLPLYYGAYQARTNAIARCLECLPGLHLASNYLGGVSVRDRIACAYIIANRIVAALKQTTRKSAQRYSKIPEVELEVGKACL